MIISRLTTPYQWANAELLSQRQIFDADFRPETVPIAGRVCARRDRHDQIRVLPVVRPGNS
jgi:hypothetical protein